MEGLLFEAIIIFILILLNGFFSGSEIAIISARRSTIDKLAKEGNRSARVVSEMKDNPDKFLATVQVGVTVVATLASVIGGVTASELLKPVIKSVPFPPLQNAAEVISIVIVVVVISFATLVIGELVPKSLALNYAERVACSTARPLHLVSRISSIFVAILTKSTGAVLKLMGIKDTGTRTFVSEEEIKFFIKEGRETGVFEETEAALLHGVFEFGDTTVREVMVPKPKMSCVDVNAPFAETARFLSEHGFSRYPVYRETPENIVGILFNKDVFRALESKEPVTIGKLMRKPYFVPNSVMISRLLREMQRRKMHMAVVVDEHGEVDGLVTIEDILEEIVGEIEDEFDVDKEGLVEKLSDGTMVVDASASLRDLEDYGIRIEEEEAEEFHTMAGFMLAKLQRIPRGGEFVVDKNNRYTVVDVEANRISKVKVEPVQPSRKRKASAI